MKRVPASAAIAAFIAGVLEAGLRGYRYAISPLFGPRCRFYPSCSAYALEALQRHGLRRGGWLAVSRLARCHPWGGSGVDLVPEDGDLSGATHGCCEVPGAAGGGR